MYYNSIKLLYIYIYITVNEKVRKTINNRFLYIGHWTLVVEISIFSIIRREKLGKL